MIGAMVAVVCALLGGPVLVLWLIPVVRGKYEQ